MKYVLIYILSVFLFGSSEVKAQVDNSADNNASESKSSFVYIYEQPTLQALSKMYWRTGIMDINNNLQIDNYMLLNECELFKEYNAMEIDWAKIRDAARQFLDKNKDGFPDRFVFSQEIFLDEYDEETGVFSLSEKSSINDIKSFEVYASDLSRTTCDRYHSEITHYPAEMVLELTRPLVLTEIPMSLRQANRYISIKTEQFIKRLVGTKYEHFASDRNAVKQGRNAFIDLKVRFLTSTGTVRIDNSVKRKFLAVLEEINIYSNKSKTNLLYSRSFIDESRDSIEGLKGAKSSTSKEMEEAIKNAFKVFLN